MKVMFALCHKLCLSYLITAINAVDLDNTKSKHCDTVIK